MSNEENEPYCTQCGGQELAYIRTVANGDEYQCKACGHTFLHHEPAETPMSNEKEKHTPTPWHYDADNNALVAADGQWIMQGFSKHEQDFFNCHVNLPFAAEACNSHACLKAENERLRKIILTIRSAACSLEAEFPGDEDNTVNADWIIEITEPAVTTTNTTQQ